jgi:hypothetical protein
MARWRSKAVRRRICCAGSAHPCSSCRNPPFGELYDLREDPGEFDDRWDSPAHRELKHEVMRRHIDAVMATISPGPRRVIQY